MIRIFFGVLCFFSCVSLSAQEKNSEILAKHKLKTMFKMFYNDKGASVASFNTVYDIFPSFELEYIKIKKDQEFNGEYKGKSYEVLRLRQSLVFLEMQRHLMNVVGDISLDVIFNVIDSTEFLYEGVFYSVFELKLPTGINLYFAFEGYSFCEIWMHDGTPLKNLILGVVAEEELRLPGMINDPDGYVNIREEETSESLIVGKFMKDDLFYYVPNSYSNWWKVYRLGDIYLEGYIHNSRILEFNNFLEKYKEIVRKDIGGCEY